VRVGLELGNVRVRAKVTVGVMDGLRFPVRVMQCLAYYLIVCIRTR